MQPDHACGIESGARQGYIQLIGRQQLKAAHRAERCRSPHHHHKHACSLWRHACREWWQSPAEVSCIVVVARKQPVATIFLGKKRYSVAGPGIGNHCCHKFSPMNSSQMLTQHCFRFFRSSFQLCQSGLKMLK